MTAKEQYNEQDLLLRLSAGDENAFKMLYEQYRDAIYSTACHLSGSPLLAEEVVQDVFLDVWLKRSNASGIVYLKSYLHRMASNKIFDMLQWQYRQERLLSTVPANDDQHSTPGILLEHKDYNAVLSRAIERLPSKQRETYMLIRQQGFSREQAAGRLGVSPETVKSNLDQAMRSVRAYCMTQIGISSGILLLLKLV